MIRAPHDLQRYTASERANHWVTGICFILLALSGLALFHPALFPLTMLFGGGVWTRILHPFVGVVMMLFFVVMFFRFQSLNRMTGTDWEWVKRAREMVNGDDHNMPIMGKYNGGQKLVFWLFALCLIVLLVTGALFWQAWFAPSVPIWLQRIAVVLHALAAFGLVLTVIVHAYAAIWVKGTVQAMTRGTVSAGWARHHHPLWYREQVQGRTAKAPSK